MCQEQRTKISKWILALFLYRSSQGRDTERLRHRKVKEQAKGREPVCALASILRKAVNSSTNQTNCFSHAPGPRGQQMFQLPKRQDPVNI